MSDYLWSTVMRGVLNHTPVDFATVVQGAVDTVTRSIIAMNSGQFSDYYPDWWYLNLAKQMRKWQPLNSSFQAIDAGQVTPYTEIPAGATYVGSIWAWGSFPDFILTDYILTYEGEGTLQVGATVNSRTDSATGGMIDFTITEKRDITFRLTAIPDPANPPRNFRIVRKNTDDAARLDAGEVFNPNYLASLRPGGKALEQYRHLNSMVINNSTVRDYSDLPKISDEMYTEGMPLELVIQLANEIGHDPWICVPAQASPACIRSMAQEAQSLLDPDLKIIVEPTNEHWNAGFEQRQQFMLETFRDWVPNTDAGTMAFVADKDYTVTNPANVAVGDHIVWEHQTNRTFGYSTVLSVVGNTVTLNFGGDTSLNGATAYAADFVSPSSAYARFAEMCFREWEAGSSVRPLRVMGTQLSNLSVTTDMMNAPLWSSDPDFVDPLTFTDVIATGTYIFNASNAEIDTLVYDAFNTSFETGRDFILNRALNTEDLGVDELDKELAAQSAITKLYGIPLWVYEGFADHTLADNFGSLLPAQIAPLVASYEQLIYSAEYNVVWEAAYGVLKRHIEGPLMVYVELAPVTQYSLFGNRRFGGDTQARYEFLLNLGDTETQYWGDVAPQTTDLFQATVVQDTNASQPYSIKRWFTANTASIVATSLPGGFSLSSTGVLTPTSNAVSDEIVNTTYTVTSETGKVSTFVVQYDIRYVAPVVLPATSYSTDFDNPSDPDIQLYGNASISGGLLVCDDPAVQSYGRLRGYEALMVSEDPDVQTYSFSYRVPVGSPLVSGSGVLSFAGMQIHQDFFRVRTNNDGAESVRQTDGISWGGVVDDGAFHRFVVTLNYLTNDAAVWHDGVKVAEFSAADMGVNENIARPAVGFVAKRTDLGAAFSGVTVVDFANFRAWFGEYFDELQVNAVT